MGVAALLNPKDKTLAEVKINTLGDTLGDVACEVEISADTLAQVEPDPHGDTLLGHLKGKALITTLAVALKPVKNTGLAA